MNNCLHSKSWAKRHLNCFNCLSCSFQPCVISKLSIDHSNPQTVTSLSTAKPDIYMDCNSVADFLNHPLLILKSIISRAEIAPLFISIKISLMVPPDIKQHPFQNLAYSSLSQLSDEYSIQLNSFFKKWHVTALTQKYLHLVNHSVAIKFKCSSSQRWIWSALQLMLNMDSQRRWWV